jgi:hypothetical protein
MRTQVLTYGFLASAFSLVSATALTYKLVPNEKACFFTWAGYPNSKVAFYFAVSVCAQVTPGYPFSNGPYIDRSCRPSRFNLAARSISIIPFLAPMRK